MSDVKVPDLNQVMLAGRLTRDPELKYTSGGQAYCKIGVANTRYWKDKSGQRQETTTFVDVTVWGPHAEYVGEAMRKGHAVLVEAKLTTNQWEDRQTGQKHNKLELTAHRVNPLEWHGTKADGQQGGDGKPAPAQSAPNPAPADAPNPEDDIPFD